MVAIWKNENVTFEPEHIQHYICCILLVTCILIVLKYIQNNHVMQLFSNYFRSDLLNKLDHPDISTDRMIITFG